MRTATGSLPSLSGGDPGRQRHALLSGALCDFLLGRGLSPPEAARLASAWDAALLHWLRQPARWRGRLLPACAEMFASSAGPPLPGIQDGAAFPRAFAGRLMARARAEVEAEAWRAGHGGTFALLSPFLDQAPPADAVPGLCAGCGLDEPALQRALARLRRRFRQRIDHCLGLWSDSPESRAGLRRELRAALIQGNGK